MSGIPCSRCNMSPSIHDTLMLCLNCASKQVSQWGLENKQLRKENEDLRRNIDWDSEVVKAEERAYKKATQWIKCADLMPKMGEHIVLYYPLPNNRWSWCSGVVDGSDDGLFVDYELDGQEITTACYWIRLPEPPILESDESK